MAVIPIQLGAASEQGRFPASGGARLVNCYMEPASETARAQRPVYSCAGLQSYTTIAGASGGIRALIPVDGNLLIICGRQAYLLRPGGQITAVGGIPTIGPVYWAINRRQPNAQVAVVSDGLYYVYESGVLSAVSDPALPSPTSVDFLDGYFLFSEYRGRITRSELDNATTFDGLAFEAAQANPDPLVRVITHERQLVAFGTRSVEFWTSDASVDPFAFSRVTASDVGCAAAGSVARVAQTVCWIAHDLTVRALNGYGGQKISSYSVDRWIATIADLNAVTALSYSLGGHTFYALSAPEGTWEYNLTTSQWHERESYNKGRWRVSAVAPFGNYLIAGDVDSPTLYILTTDAYGEGADPLIMTCQQPVNAFPYRMRFNRLDIDAIPGVGLLEVPDPTAGGGQPIGLLLALTSAADGSAIAIANAWLSDPTMIVDWSDDAGVTWHVPRGVSLGKAGQAITNMRVLRLGTSSKMGRVFRLRVSAAVARGFLALTADVDKIAA